MPRHKLRRPPVDRTLLAMIVITLLVVGLGFIGLSHSRDGNDPGTVCRHLPGTTRLDCG